MKNGNYKPLLLYKIFLWVQTVTEDDILKTELWHKYPGNRPPYRYDNSFLACSLLCSFYLFLYLVDALGE